jgi:glycosyltransferase involved in cell wall biosynthesis
VNSSPEVSVVLPSRDRPELATRAAQCGLGQRDVDVEVLVVDDASRGGIPALAAIDDGRLQVFHNASRRGVAASRNRGIAEARGKWVAFLDDDDLWAPDKLARQLETARAEGATLVHCGWIELDEELRPLRERSAAVSADPGREILEHNLCGPPSSVVVRRTALVDAEGFDPELSVMADWDLWIRITISGGKLLSGPEALVAYTVHGGGMHLRQLDTVLQELAVLRAKHGDGVGGPRFQDWLASAYRDAGRRGDAARLRLSLALRERRPGELRRAAGALLTGTPLRPRGASEESPPEPAWVTAWRKPTSEVAPAVPPSDVRAAPGASS